MEETAQCDNETEREPDDVTSSSDFKNTRSYCLLQRDVAGVFDSIHKLIELPEYHVHVRKEAYMDKMKDIDKQLESRKDDLMKTDCAIVVAGETSAGKSSVINLIIGEDILPMGMKATTSRICRMKYSDKLQISTCNSDDEQKDVTEFDDRKDMVKKLSELAKTKDDEIKYIDVWLPIEILRGNIVIVDTPGIGEPDQEEEANMMMDYLPNALAFVFVVNVSNAGGLQRDRLVRILERVRGSLDQMHSFDPKDAIFLLNKWDSMKRNPEKTEMFEVLKRDLHEIWKDVKDDFIFQFAATEVNEDKAYQREFHQFQVILKNIIAENENKRINVHTKFIGSFIDGCEVVVPGKIKCAKQTTEENVKIFAELTEKLQETERTRQEAFVNLQHTIDEFLKETTEALHQYIHSQSFKRRILKDLATYSRLTIRSEMDSRINKETYRWQRINIEEAFKRKVMEKIAGKFIDIHKSLHRIKDTIKGFTSPFDVENKIAGALVCFFAPSAPMVAGGFLMAHFSGNRDAAIAVVAAGLLSGVFLSGFKMLDVLDDVEDTIIIAYKARVDTLTTDKIKRSLTKAYAEQLENILKNFLEGDLKEEIENLKRTVASMQKRVDYFQKEESNLISLRCAISELRKRHKVLENTDVKMD